MHHALSLDNIESLVQIGVRDIGHKEMEKIKSNPERIHTFFDCDIKNCLYKGDTWDVITENIISLLDENVYISFDIDGLEPSLCPNTGTPVPGGMAFNEFTYLLRQLTLKNKKIIGFDLCEVSSGNDDWDANVGARILFKIVAATAFTNKLI